MRYFVTVDGRTFEVVLGAEGATVDGTTVTAHLAQVEGTEVRSLVLDGASFRILAQSHEAGHWDLHLRGRRFAVEAVDERTRTLREVTGTGRGPVGPRPIRAPMPGLVVKVEVAEGDRVEAGQGVVIMEAMKMENELRAEGPGIVARVHVSAGEAVEKDQILIDLSAVEEEA